MDTVTGTLPGGYWDADGVLHRDVELVALTGREEELLAQARRVESASLVTRVLSRGVRRIGTVSPVSEHVARQLLVADRHYLLLRLRQMTFGDAVRAHVFCPWRDCGRRVSLEFGIDDVPVGEAVERAPSYTMTLSPIAGAGQAGVVREIRFRLPNGEDQEAISGLLAVNEAGALSALFARTMLSIDESTPPSPEQIAALTPLARAEIEAEMARLAPQIELGIDARCSECGRTFEVPFDLQRCFFGDLRTDSDLLYRQVHYLAYHYHWSEGEIMDMPRDKREKYIEVLADEIEKLNHAD